MTVAATQAYDPMQPWLPIIASNVAPPKTIGALHGVPAYDPLEPGYDPATVPKTSRKRELDAHDVRAVVHAPHQPAAPIVPANESNAPVQVEQVAGSNPRAENTKKIVDVFSSMFAHLQPATTTAATPLVQVASTTVVVTTTTVTTAALTANPTTARAPPKTVVSDEEAIWMTDYGEESEENAVYDTDFMGNASSSFVSK